MSQTLALVAKNDEAKNSMLSREFLMFTSGPDIIENSEFSQIEMLLSISLRLFRTYPENTLPDTSEIQYRLCLAENQNDVKAAILLRDLIVQKELDWRKSYLDNSGGWIPHNDLLKLCDGFIDRLEQRPNFWTKMDYTRDWGTYFSKRGYIDHYSSTSPSPVNQPASLESDIATIKAFLMNLSEERHPYVGFLLF